MKLPFGQNRVFSKPLQAKSCGVDVSGFFCGPEDYFAL